jgi:hypothetical protein
MRRINRSGKRDANEKPIVEALEAYGAYVRKLAGNGVPDLLVRYRGIWTPLEVKAEKGRLTKAQIAADAAEPFTIVRSIDDALRAIGVPT